MVWHGECGIVIFFYQDNVAASLSRRFPSKRFKNFYDLTATEYRQAWH